jgi:hypothetical protein
MACKFQALQAYRGLKKLITQENGKKPPTWHLSEVMKEEGAVSWRDFSSTEPAKESVVAVWVTVR